jgi:hypothetical protein
MRIIGGGCRKFIFHPNGATSAKETPLQVKIVSYGQSYWQVRQFIKEQ